jgi:hypothetical protein
VLAVFCREAFRQPRRADQNGAAGTAKPYYFSVGVEDGQIWTVLGSLRAYPGVAVSALMGLAVDWLIFPWAYALG